MSDGSITSSGDTIWTEDTGDTRGKIARSKISLGAVDADDGDVSDSNPMPVSVNNFPTTQSVSGTVTIVPSGVQTVTVNNFPTTQSVSGTVTIVPSGVQTVSIDNLPGTQPISGTVSISSGTVTIVPSGTQTISGSVNVSNFPTTQPVSATSLPLPTGASTSAKQPALGTAGTPSSDVISVQGVSSMTPLKVDGSGVTQPVSGSVSVSGTITTVTSVGSILNPLPAGTNTIGNITQNDPTATTGNITAVDNATSSVSTTSGQAFITGTPTTNSFIGVTLSGASSFSVQITGTFSATLQIETSEDGGTTWIQHGVYADGTVVSLSTITTNGSFSGNASSLTNVRVRCTAYTSGTVVVRIQPSYGVGHPRATTVVGGVASGTTLSGNPVLIAGSDGTNVRTLSTDTGGKLYSHTNAVRNSGILHRSAITTVDKLSVPTVGSASAITESGSTLSNVAYYYTVSAYNRWGATTAASIQSITPTANQAVRIPITSVTNADGYDIFLSTTANGPAWVGRITASQFSSGSIISSVGVISAGGSANSVDIGIVGTGVASSAAPFLANNAYTPALPTPISCVGYSIARVLVKLAITDLRSLPTINVIPFFANQLSAGDWHQGTLQSLAPCSAAGLTLCQDFILEVDGSTDLVLLIDTISGQGAACSIWVELA